MVVTVDLEAVRKLEEQLRAADDEVAEIAYIINTSPTTIADTLRDLRAEVARLRARLALESAALEQSCSVDVQNPITVTEALDRAIASYRSGKTALVAERDTALARVKELEAERVAGVTGLDNEIVLMLRAERDHARGRVEQLEQEIDSYRSDIDTLQRELADAQDERCHHPREWDGP